MFQFPWFASCTYVFSTRYSACAEWVPPFRDLWITVCLPTPQSLSQATTSFIASDCQGIHRMRSSEEHTSELQSRQYLVCRLLLEKTTNDLYRGYHRSRHRSVQPSAIAVQLT